jgi:ABC-2 type transport system ATP-binding protein
MLQSSGLPAGAHVGEVVRFARALYPHPLRQDELLERSGLANLATRPVSTLSGGETQRLRFALAIAGDPDLVFLDEPTVAMDVETRRAFWSDMRRFAAEGRTILFATHYLEEADQVADRIVVLDRGRIVADGTPASIKAAARGRTVRFTLAGADADLLARLPGVVEQQIHGADVTLRTDDADATVAAVYAAGLPIRDLEVTGADLESAFVALTSDQAA